MIPVQSKTKSRGTALNALAVSSLLSLRNEPAGSHNDATGKLAVTINPRTARAGRVSVDNELQFRGGCQYKRLDDLEKKRMKPLPAHFSPGPFDVICAKGKHAKNHAGNVRFRQIVDMFSANYGNVANRSQKTILVNNIISSVHNANGAFVKFENGHWFQVGETLTREKVGQCLREKNHGMYRSSTKAKRKMRKDMNQKIIDQVTTVMNTNGSVAAGLDQLSSSLEKHRKQTEQQKKEAAADPDGASSSSDESDMALELAMTRANSQILDSLKNDQTLQTMLQDESREKKGQE